MTSVLLVPATFDRHVPELMVGHNVVALIPADGYPAWSAMNAWRLARCAAAAGRRTALVDCVVDEPVLHTVAGAPNDVGLVDAFEYGASLSRIAQRQPEANLFFIPAGTFAPEPDPVLTNPRWRRLSAGFRHEEALLLLFVPDDRLEALSAELDGLIVLAPQGMDLAIARAPGVAQAMSRGLPLLAVIGDAPPPALSGEQARPADLPPEAPPTPAATAPPAEMEKAGPRPAFRRSSAPMAMLVPPPRTPPWALYTFIIVALIGAGAWLYRDSWMRMVGIAPAPLPAERFVHHAPPPHPVDSLPLAVQVAATTTLPLAFDRVDSLEAHGTPAFVTPIRLGNRIWFRVHAGPVATEAAADSLLRALRAAGLASASSLTAAAPLSIALAGGLLRDSAIALRARLRAQGMPVFVLGQADRRFRLYAGAFEDSAQAARLQELLTSISGAGELVPRVGFLP